MCVCVRKSLRIVAYTSRMISLLDMKLMLKTFVQQILFVSRRNLYGREANDGIKIFWWPLEHLIDFPNLWHRVSSWPHATCTLATTGFGNACVHIQLQCHFGETCHQLIQHEHAKGWKRTDPSPKGKSEEGIGTKASDRYEQM